jgi:hypothetical protein
MTTPPTPPRDLSEHDRAGIAGTIHECDPAAVARLKALMAQQRPPRWQEARDASTTARASCQLATRGHCPRRQGAPCAE